MSSKFYNSSGNNHSSNNDKYLYKDKIFKENSINVDIEEIVKDLLSTNGNKNKFNEIMNNLACEVLGEENHYIDNNNNSREENNESDEDRRTNTHANIVIDTSSSVPIADNSYFKSDKYIK